MELYMHLVDSFYHIYVCENIVCKTLPVEKTKTIIHFMRKDGNCYEKRKLQHFQAKYR